MLLNPIPSFFFFNDPATTEIYPFSLHDALPISRRALVEGRGLDFEDGLAGEKLPRWIRPGVKGMLDVVHEAEALFRHQPVMQRQRIALVRSEEHTSELQSPDHLVCRLLLEKKK